MNVVFLTLASEGGASPRYRVYQYLPWLERAGIRCTVLPAVSARASRRLYGTGRRSANAAYQAAELACRLAQLARARRFDTVVVQKSLLTVGLRGLDRLAAAAAGRLVIDVDDAVHLGPPHRLAGWLRALEDEAQPARLLTRADRVVAGSEALAASIRPLNPHVSIVPTCVDTDRLVPGRAGRGRTPVIGWIGSPSTAPYLELLAGTLRRLARKHRFVLRVVGAEAPRLAGVTVEARPWDPDRELHDLHGFDIGIMPLPDTPWARGKCGLKAVQYLAVGIPAVCSPVGAAPEIVRQSHEGFLAATASEWEAALELLLCDPGLRARLGAAGRARAEERYSLRAGAPKLVTVLEAIDD
ncbi:Glycosyltransferase [Gaiella occulta]|uniref:Glycosyltransferase n=1 Tax=Gaiella occulta TaxID=1002870 RepID=A0A7M2Z1G3_9ACTN|nr:glycosyltransferase family 4 protein [Gaiella occulta]RDI76258.1 Glycosyltransferase [Gaiella occulta]